jgi:hypothetical protein
VVDAARVTGSLYLRPEFTANSGSEYYGGDTSDLALFLAGVAGSSAARPYTVRLAGIDTADFPLLTSVGEGAFGETGTTALTITLGGTAPTVGAYMFIWVYVAKTVTVKVPSGAGGYGTVPLDNWGNAFRGKGWDGASYLNGKVIENITLIIEYINE